MLINSSESKNIRIRPRIIGGKKATPSQFPYMVSLRVKKQSKVHLNEYFLRHFCGGALLNDHWVISAGHCLFHNNHSPKGSLSNIRIVVRTNDYWNDIDGEVYKIKRAILHDGYIGVIHENDLCFLQTVKKIVFSKMVQPIEITKQWIGTGQDGVLSGFGHVSSGDFHRTNTNTGINRILFMCLGNPSKVNVYPDHLQFAQLYIVSNDECIQLHWKRRKHKVHNTTICATKGNKTRGSYADSGSPFVIGNKLIGITSWGAPHFHGFLTHFMRLSEYIEWINEKISEYSFEN